MQLAVMGVRVVALDVKTLAGWQKVAGVAAAATVLGAFLPWVSLFGISVIGVQGDGVMTLVLGLIGLAALAAAHGVGPIRIGPFALVVIEGVCAVLVSIVAIYDMNNFAAIGLYLTLLAGLAWSGASVVGWRSRPRRSPSGTPPQEDSVPEGTPPLA